MFANIDPQAWLLAILLLGGVVYIVLQNILKPFAIQPIFEKIFGDVIPYNLYALVLCGIAAGMSYGLNYAFSFSAVQEVFGSSQYSLVQSIVAPLIDAILQGVLVAGGYHVLGDAGRDVIMAYLTRSAEQQPTTLVGVVRDVAELYTDLTDAEEVAEESVADEASSPAVEALG